MISGEKNVADRARIPSILILEDRLGQNKAFTKTAQKATGTKIVKDAQLHSTPLYTYFSEFPAPIHQIWVR